MSKLSTLRQALVSNPKVVIVGEPMAEYLSTGGGSYYPETRHTSWSWDGFDRWIISQTYRFVVAPKGGLYTAKELQKFMMGLTNDLKPAYVKDFIEAIDNLEFGYLLYKEEIAEEKRFVTRRIELTDKEAEFSNFKDGLWVGAPPNWPVDVVEDISHIREIFIMPYPNEIIAAGNRNVAYYPDKSISLKDLKKQRFVLIS